MSLPRYRLHGQPQQKIRPEHLDRAAVVYVGWGRGKTVVEPGPEFFTTNPH